MERISLEEAKNLQPFIRTPLGKGPDYYTIEIDDRGWEEIKYYTSHNRIDPNNKDLGSEYIYVLGNDYMSNIIKIGYTSKDPVSRAHEISKATGVPSPFKVLYQVKCFNGLKIEKATHNHLSKYKTQSNKEFFEIDLEDAIEIILKYKELFG